MVSIVDLYVRFRLSVTDIFFGILYGRVVGERLFLFFFVFGGFWLGRFSVWL